MGINYVKSVKIDDLHKPKQQSFIVVRKFNARYQLNDKFRITDIADNFLGIFFIRSIELFRLDKINSTISFMDKNCNVDIYTDIMKQVYGVTEKDTLMSIVFSNANPLREC
ncbi:hypothetical protein [Tenacibaculum agarivorans]|uniref:hypothetical protein n=1 Tax=Tenacibaculum agarivorans TaxID=1908389 RepID=UPI00094BBC29|nr:hypothetical protein [Tenacibaculum agarivorans]